MQLRDYQQEALQKLKKSLIEKKNVLLTAPCAAGKTVIFCNLIKWMVDNKRRCLVLMDRNNLVDQTAQAIRKNICFDDVGTACASIDKKKSLDEPVVVASRQTLTPMLKNGYKNVSFNLTIIDEVHLANQKKNQYHDIIETLRNNYPGMRLFGCTATPYRLSGGKIYGKERWFDRVDHAITAKQLLDKGFLVPLRWKVKQSDLLGKLNAIRKSSTGDLNEQDQSNLLSQEIYIESIYEVWEQYAIDRKTVIYAITIEHAELISEIFESNGVKTWIIHSKMSVKDVQKNIEEFKSSFGIMVNVGILTIGSDIPSIECILLARRTLSTALFFQIVGRGARLSPGKKDCLILDICGNSFIHGIDPDKPIVTFDLNEKNDKDKVKACPMCEAVTSLNSEQCPCCGFEFPKEEIEREEMEETDDDTELTEFKGFDVFEADEVLYFYHQAKGKSIPTVRVEYYMRGRLIAKQWLCPQHVGFPRKKSEWYWWNLGGKFPIPKTVDEWVNRAHSELCENVELQIMLAGKWPEVKGCSPLYDDIENAD